MNVISQVLAVLVGLILIGVGVLEAFFYRNPRFFSIFRIRPEDASAVRLWVTNLGFYNIIYGIVCIVGVVLINVANPDAGRALIYMVCISHVVLAVVLAIVEPKLWRNSLYEGVLPLLVILIALVWP
jgi:putative membrane protein